VMGVVRCGEDHKLDVVVGEHGLHAVVNRGVRMVGSRLLLHLRVAYSNTMQVEPFRQGGQIRVKRAPRIAIADHAKVDHLVTSSIADSVRWPCQTPG